jgi:hypothetical protein
MGCIIKIGNQSVSETDFLNHLNKIISVNKLFEENPDFSSQIYEALGFKNTNYKQVSIGNAKEDITAGKYVYIYPIVVDNITIGKIPVTENIENKVFINSVGDELVQLKTDYRNKGYGKAAYLELAKIIKNSNATLYSSHNMSSDARRVWNSLMRDGYAEQYKNGQYRFINAALTNKVTPQQKQQAQLLYSNFLSSFVNSNFDTIIQDLESKNILNKKCS